MTPDTCAYQAETLAFRLIAYSGTVVPDTDDHLATVADRDVVDTSLQFAIKARRWVQANAVDKGAVILSTAHKLPLTYQVETNFLNALHGIIHSKWLFSDWSPHEYAGFPGVAGKMICGLMFETDKYPRRSVGLEALASTYLNLRHPEEFGHRLKEISL